MGTFRMDIPNELTKLLSTMETQMNEISVDAVKEAEPIVVDALKAECSKHNVSGDDKTRGQMVASIKATGPKKNALGIYDFVRPTGKDSKGVRNMEKLAYLEYGTSKQPATPVCQKVKDQISKKVADTMETRIKRGFGI